MIILSSPRAGVKSVIFILGSVLLLSLAGSCLGKEKAAIKQNGTIEFTVNGEEFVRHGFIDKNGWAISFDNFYINIVDPEAYNLSEGVRTVLEGAYWVDLAGAKDNPDLLTIGKLDNVAPGNYQSLKFKIRRRAAGEYQGFSLVIIGEARKEQERFDFVLKFDEEMDYDGREGYVGEEVKGLLQAGGKTAVEMTFHVDHIFGDKSAAPEEHVNVQSVGFDYFKRFKRQNTIELTQADLKRQDKERTGYLTLVRALWNLGHLGEGHCEVSGQSSAAEVSVANP